MLIFWESGTQIDGCLFSLTDKDYMNLDIRKTANKFISEELGIKKYILWPLSRLMDEARSWIGFDQFYAYSWDKYELGADGKFFKMRDEDYKEQA